jgi:hypothetical protein
MRRNARVAIGLCVALLILAIPGLLQLEVERDATLAVIPETDPVGETYARYQELFPGDVGTMVVATGELCTPEKWLALIDLSDALAALPVVDKVTGLPTVEYVSGMADRVEVEDLVDLHPERDEKLCHLARDYRPYQSLLLTEDLGAMALYVRGSKELDVVTINAEIEPVIQSYRPRFLDAADGDLFQAGLVHDRATPSGDPRHPVRPRGRPLDLCTDGVRRGQDGSAERARRPGAHPTRRCVHDPRLGIRRITRFLEMGIDT